MSSKEESYRDARKFYVFMIFLGLLGMMVSWFTLLPVFLPSVPGLSIRTTGRVTGYQKVSLVDFPFETTVSIVQFTDTRGLSHTVSGDPRLQFQASVNVLYLEQKPDYAFTAENPNERIVNLLSVPCIDLVCIALIALGIYMLVVHGKPKAADRRNSYRHCT